MGTAQAFVLLTLPNVTLVHGQTGETGWLSLACINESADEEVHLVLRLGAFEMFLDSSRNVDVTTMGSRRIYHFYGTGNDPVDFTLYIEVPHSDRPDIMEDLGTFEGILSQYGQLQGSPLMPVSSHEHHPPNNAPAASSSTPSGDLAGRLVLVDQTNGQIVGEFDQGFRVTEDPKSGGKGDTSRHVLVEIPQHVKYRPAPLDSFKQAIPPGQHDLITKSAIGVSRLLTFSSTLMAKVMASSSSWVISHTKPAGPFQATPRAGPPTATRQALVKAYGVSTEANDFSDRVVGRMEAKVMKSVEKRKAKEAAKEAAKHRSSPPEPLISFDSPPPYSRDHLASSSALDKRSENYSPAPLHPSGSSSSSSPYQNTKLKKREKAILSLGLIFDTLDRSTVQVFDSATDWAGTTVGHRCVLFSLPCLLHLAAGTVGNFNLIFSDTRGVQRTAVIRQGGHYV